MMDSRSFALFVGKAKRAMTRHNQGLSVHQKFDGCPRTIEIGFRFGTFQHESIARKPYHSSLIQNTKAGVPPALHIVL